MTGQAVDCRSRTGSIRAMGGEASVTLVGSEAEVLEVAMTRAVGRIRHLEARWSRFLPTSDVSRLNAAAGDTLTVDADTIRLVVAMVNGWRISGGAFDPTLLGALNALGYAADWSGGARHSCSAASRWRGDPDGILLDPERQLVQLPAGTSLDAGGIGKGLAADIVVEAAIAAGVEGAAVTIGGDMRVCGRAPSGEGWQIAVAHPYDDEAAVARLSLADGGVATSSTVRRRWRGADGRPVHHLLEPTTAAPAQSEVVQATLVAGTGAWAEVWSKALMVRGVSLAFPMLEDVGLAAMAVCSDGAIRATKSWRAFSSSGSVER